MLTPVLVDGGYWFSLIGLRCSQDLGLACLAWEARMRCGILPLAYKNRALTLLLCSEGRARRAETRSRYGVSPGLDDGLSQLSQDDCVRGCRSD
jgi:hypothetical protein